MKQQFNDYYNIDLEGFQRGATQSIFTLIKFWLNISTERNKGGNQRGETLKWSWSDSVAQGRCRSINYIVFFYYVLLLPN